MTILLFTIFFPIYDSIWLLNRHKAINSLNSHNKINKFILLIYLSLPILVIFLKIWLPILIIHIPYIEAIFSLVLILYFIFFWVVSYFLLFKVKNILCDHFEVIFNKKIDFSILGILLFKVCYIQYKINQFVKEEKK